MTPNTSEVARSHPGDVPPDVFISHAHEDKDAVARPLAAALERRGWTAWFDELEMHIGDSINRGLDAALARTRFGVVILSPSYFEKEWALRELDALVAREVAAGTKVILPVWHGIDRDWLVGRRPMLADRRGARTDHGIEAVAEQLTSALIAATHRADGSGRQEPLVQAVVASHTQPVTLSRRMLPIGYNLPIRNPHFVGRDDELTQLRRLFDHAGRSVTVASICGMGGLGKSQLAMRYVHEAVDQYRLVAWIRVDDGGLPDLAKLAELMGEPVDGRLVPERAAMAVRRLAQSDDPWLIVLDNVANPEQVLSCCPATGRGHVLITTRHSEVAAMGRVIKPKTFDEETAVHYLVSRAQRPGDDEAARRIAQALGGLPLALSHAGAYCAAGSGVTFTDYYDLLCDLPSDDLFRSNPEIWYQQTVATTWQVSIQEARKSAPLAPLALSMAAHLGPDAIPRSLFDVLRSDSTAKGRRDVLDGLRALARFSLADVEDTTVSVHRLLQRTIREDHAEHNDDRPQQLALDALIGTIPVEALPEQWIMCRNLVPHALAVAESFPSPHPSGEVLVRLLNTIGEVLNRAERGDALSFASVALTHAERFLAADHPDRLVARERVATARYWRGELDVTIELEAAILEDRKRVLGDDHPATLEAAANVADTHRTRGNPELAIPLQEAIIAKRIAMVEDPRRYRLTKDEQERMPKMLQTGRNKLACSYLVAARVDEAASMLEDVIVARARLSGDTDPDTIAARADLADCLIARGELATAVALCRTVLSQRQDRLPERHPDTEQARENLADALRMQWALDEARLELELLVDERSRTLGPVHARTRRARRRLNEVNAGLLVRPADAQDVDELASIKREREDEIYREYGTPDEHAHGLRSYCGVDYIERLRADRESALLVARSRDRVLGMGVVSRRPGHAWFHALFARTSRVGVGSALLAALFEKADDWRYEEVGCEIFERNELSRAYFARHGFSEAGRRPSDTYQGQSLVQYRRCAADGPWGAA